MTLVLHYSESPIMPKNQLLCAILSCYSPLLMPYQNFALIHVALISGNFVLQYYTTAFTLLVHIILKQLLKYNQGKYQNMVITAGVDTDCTKEVIKCHLVWSNMVKKIQRILVYNGATVRTDQLNYQIAVFPQLPYANGALMSVKQGNGRL